MEERGIQYFHLDVPENLRAYIGEGPCTPAVCKTSQCIKIAVLESMIYFIYAHSKDRFDVLGVW